MMGWRLFLDDERDPVTGDFTIARSVNEAICLCNEYGCPSTVYFDHDLGEHTLSGFDFAKWLVESDLHANGDFIPNNFEFHVHSQNPAGAKNIEGLLNRYLEYRDES